MVGFRGFSGGTDGGTHREAGGPSRTNRARCSWDALGRGGGRFSGILLLPSRPPTLQLGLHPQHASPSPDLPGARSLLTVSPFCPVDP